ncbi:MAG: hypothetical protein KKA73_06590 [Chloroflexi bacterium]|nr:hypothetical protein [Chloroflexota bacterium]MBU1747339.1 hypothetical protein [Chloroflexota bacterium]
MQSISVSPELEIELLPDGANDDGRPAVRLRRQEDDGGCVIYLPEVRPLIDALAWAAAETATQAVRQ